MFVKLHLPTMINGHIQSGAVVALSEATASRLIKAGVATPDPELDELKEKARRLGQNVDWEKDPKYQRPRAGVVAAVEPESFGEKLRKAVEKRHKARDQQAAREKARYKPFQRRKHCRGE